MLQICFQINGVKHSYHLSLVPTMNYFQFYANGFYSYDTLVYKFIYVFSSSAL